MHRIYDVNMNHNNEKNLPLMNSTYILAILFIYPFLTLYLYIQKFKTFVYSLNNMYFLKSTGLEVFPIFMIICIRNIYIYIKVATDAYQF